jgi:hypothetical protein
MDASDRIRKLQAKAVFTYYKTSVLNPAKCNTTGCSAGTAGLGVNCIVNYPNFQEKLQMSQGKNACLDCSGGC